MRPAAGSPAPSTPLGPAPVGGSTEVAGPDPAAVAVSDPAAVTAAAEGWAAQAGSSSSSRLDASSVDLGPARAVAARHVDSGLIPCASFGIVDAAGRMSQGTVSGPRLAIAEDSVFFLASVSKAIVATTVMRYVDEGRLEVHAPVARYLPELDGLASGGVTGWHVLTHTSGLPDIPLERLRTERPSYQRALELVAGSQPAWPPGSRYEYNSAAWLLLSEVLARLSGMPFDEVLARRLTGPLGMDTTGFDPRAWRARLVPVRGSRMDNRLVQEMLLRFLARARMPGGGLFGSLPDLLRLGRALLPADERVPGPRILRQAAIDEMARQQAEGLSHTAQDGQVHEIRQALGWRKPQAEWPGSARAFTHGGIAGGRIWVDPEAGFAFAFLTSVWQAPLAPALEVLEAIYAALG
jgi:serine-type D-Ala-D-Ala carboxypeptidase